MKEIYDLINKTKKERGGIINSFELMGTVKSMNDHEVFNLARYMYWSSSVLNQQYDLYFNDIRYRHRTDLFIAIIYSLSKRVTTRYTFQYADLTPYFEEYTNKFPPHKEFKVETKFRCMLDNIHLGSPLAVVLYRLLYKRHRKAFKKLVTPYLVGRNTHNIHKVKLNNMYQLFWQLSCPTQDPTGLLHAEAIAVYSCVEKKELVLHSFFDFMDEFLEDK